jgi:hypothetical protein
LLTNCSPPPLPLALERRRKEGRKEGRKERRKEGRKEGRKGIMKGIMKGRKERRKKNLYHLERQRLEFCPVGLEVV